MDEINTNNQDFPWLSPDEVAKLKEYATKNNLDINTLYQKTVRTKKLQDYMNKRNQKIRQLEATDISWLRPDIQAKDKMFFRTTNFANYLRKQAFNSWIDTSSINDDKLLQEFVKANPQNKQILKAYINWDDNLLNKTQNNHIWLLNKDTWLAWLYNNLVWWAEDLFTSIWKWAENIVDWVLWAWEQLANKGASAYLWHPVKNDWYFSSWENLSDQTFKIANWALWVYGNSVFPIVSYTLHTLWNTEDWKKILLDAWNAINEWWNWLNHLPILKQYRDSLSPKYQKEFDSFVPNAILTVAWTLWKYWINKFKETHPWVWDQLDSLNDTIQTIKKIPRKEFKELNYSAHWIKTKPWLVDWKIINIDLPQKWLFDNIKWAITEPVKTKDLTKLVNRAFTPSRAWLNISQKVDLLKNTLKDATDLYKQVRTWKLNGNINSLQDTAQTVVDNLKTVWDKIWQAISKTKGEIKIPEELKTKLEESINTEWSKVAPAVAPVKKLLSELEWKDKLTPQQAFELKKAYWNEVSKLYKAWDAGTKSYTALRDTVDYLNKSIDNIVDKTEWLKDLKSQYALLKRNANNIVNSAVVDSRSAPMWLAEQMWFIDNILNPIWWVKNAIIKEMADANSRWWAWQRFVKLMDKNAISKVKPENVLDRTWKVLKKEWKIIKKEWKTIKNIITDKRAFIWNGGKIWKNLDFNWNKEINLDWVKIKLSSDWVSQLPKKILKEKWLNPKDEIYIDLIKTDKLVRWQWKDTKAMEELINIAEKEWKYLVLKPVAQGWIPQTKLINWYKKLWFKKIDNGLMVKLPNTIQVYHWSIKPVSSIEDIQIWKWLSSWWRWNYFGDWIYFVDNINDAKYYIREQWKMSNIKWEWSIIKYKINPKNILDISWKKVPSKFFNWFVEYINKKNPDLFLDFWWKTEFINLLKDINSAKLWNNLSYIWWWNLLRDYVKSLWYKWLKVNNTVSEWAKWYEYVLYK